MYEFNATKKGWRIHWGPAPKSSPKAVSAREPRASAGRFDPRAGVKLTVRRFKQKDSRPDKAWPFVY
jgi:hypothetical protein